MLRPPASRYRAFEVVLDDRQRHALTVRRAPLFLRFVLVGDDWATLDCLDQFDDEPNSNERVIAAEKGECTPVHIKFQQRSKSGWYLWVKYKTIDAQPPEDVLRQTERWRQWCRERAAARS